MNNVIHRTSSIPVEARQAAEECDATMKNSSNTAGLIKKNIRTSSFEIADLCAFKYWLLLCNGIHNVEWKVSITIYKKDVAQLRKFPLPDFICSCSCFGSKKEQKINEVKFKN